LLLIPDSGHDDDSDAAGAPYITIRNKDL